MSFELIQNSCKRNHDFRMWVITFFLQFYRSTQDSASLHFCDFRICITQTATTVTEHRVMFAQAFYTLTDVFYCYTHSLSHFFLSFQIVRNEFVQRWIKQTNVHRTSVHCLKDTNEVGLLIWQQFCESFLTSFYCRSQNHFAHCNDLLVIEEHMFCTAQTDTCSAKTASHFRIVRSISVSTYF